MWRAGRGVYIPLRQLCIQWRNLCVFVSLWFDHHIMHVLDARAGGCGLAEILTIAPFITPTNIAVK